MQQATRLKFLGLWLLLGSLAALACSSFWPAAHLDTEYLPVTNDSFYHARRILDTASDPSSFYEFDEKIHAPEGSLLNWPWGYDYAMGWLVRLSVITGVASDPMQFLIWVPVAAVFISVGLMMLIARQLSLSVWSTVIAGLGVALSPLTTLLHGTGMIDHHFAEYIFVLASIAFGLRWLSNPAQAGPAACLGILLGLAPAVHNALFVLQIPVLSVLLAFWLQDIRISKRATAFFCLALITSTLMILLPSLPFRLGHFEFYTLSWFHLYVAAGTAIVAFMLSCLARTPHSLALLGLTALILLVPLGRQILVAQSFMAGTITRLDAISEMRSIRQMTFSGGGLYTVSTLYSLLVWLVPLTAGYCIFRGWVERSSGRLFFWVYSIFGLAMLVTQFRLHYFGSFALLLPLLVFTENLTTKWPERRRQTMLAASLLFVLMFAIPVRYFLLGPPPAPAADAEFAKLRPVLGTLKTACTQEPGIVLADNDAGHYIRYYTDCSVIANNFLLTRQHEEKIHQIDYLTSLSAQALPEAAPYVRYILLRPVSMMRTAENTYTYMSFSPKSAQLINQLLLEPASDAPPNYALLDQANIVNVETGEAFPYIRLYKVMQGE